MLNIERYRKELETKIMNLDCDTHNFKRKIEGISCNAWDSTCLSKTCKECRKDNKPVMRDGISCAKCCCDYFDSGKIQEWANSEYKEPILTDEEKTYLSSVIKPFRDKVKYICKYYNANEWISIAIKKSVNIEFPHFVKGTMYKGMKVGKKYTLEELGL